MAKKVAYWISVGVVSYIVVVSIDTYSYLLTYKETKRQEKNLSVIASSELGQQSPNHNISSVFDSISNQKLFVPKHVTIESIGISKAPISLVGITVDGAMDVPKDPNIVGWYKNSPIGGETGNIVLAAHYDWYNGVKGVFYRLSDVVVGGTIDLLGSNSSHTYQVYEVKYVPNNDTLAVLEAFRDTQNQELTLITCGGVWDNVTKSYDKRFLVKALLVK